MFIKVVALATLNMDAAYSTAQYTHSEKDS
jgi:hypothetical protein